MRHENMALRGMIPNRKGRSHGGPVMNTADCFSLTARLLQEVSSSIQSHRHAVLQRPARISKNHPSESYQEAKASHRTPSVSPKKCSCIMHDNPYPSMLFTSYPLGFPIISAFRSSYLHRRTPPQRRCRISRRKKRIVPICCRNVGGGGGDAGGSLRAIFRT